MWSLDIFQRSICYFIFYFHLFSFAFIYFHLFSLLLVQYKSQTTRCTGKAPAWHSISNGNDRFFMQPDFSWSLNGGNSSEHFLRLQFVTVSVLGSGLGGEKALGFVALAEVVGSSCFVPLMRKGFPPPLLSALKLPTANCLRSYCFACAFLYAFLCTLSSVALISFLSSFKEALPILYPAFVCSPHFTQTKWGYSMWYA